MGERHEQGNKIRLLVVALLATALDIAAAVALRRMQLGATGRTVLALVPVPGNVTLMVLILRGIRRLDEFQKRVQFEAVAFAFLATMLVVFIYGYLQRAQAVGPLNAAFVWIFMTFAYAAGYGIAVRHYR